MNTLKDKLGEAMSLISTERDIVTSAKIKAEIEAGHSISDKYSESQSQKEKERFVMKKRRIITSMAAAAAAVVIVGGTVYAASPEVRETVNDILGINRESTKSYYEIFGIENSSVTNAEFIENNLAVTENDFTEFAEGIRAKLVSVVNSGSFAEVLLEFEFDKPIKDGEYVLEDVIISAFPKYLPSYIIGSLTVTDSGKIYGTVRLNEINKIPEDMTMTMEIKTLAKAKSRNVHNTDETYGYDQSVKIHGSFSADFSIGAPIKPYSANVEPAEISWTHPRMGGETAHMEITALKYSPKEISVDLRMLEDFLVIYNDDFGGAQYFNNTQMFFDGIAGEKKAMPLKLKMSDGSLRDVWYSDVNSNAVNDIDKNTLVTDMDWIKACWDIYSDKPTVVTFQLAGIMDYTDVEAIVFCGKEIPITEKNF
ncbi:MAG: hypothetical protein K2K44_08610 [Oscillospiraceae bacterium]|nr:hypothetical protein [Oscillospiraceae bacterium]